MNDHDRIINLVKKYTRGRCDVKGDEILTFCPFCGETRLKFSFNLRKRVGHCWICEKAVHGLKFYLYKLGVPSDEVNGRGNDLTGETSWQKQKRGVLRRLLGLSRGQVSLQPHELPNGAERVLSKPGAVRCKYVREYLWSRGLTGETIKLLNPYIHSNWPDWFILPVVMEGEVVFWTRRNMQRGEPKYLSPSTRDEMGKQFRLGKGDVVWGMDLTDQGGECIICEGILSAASVVQMGRPAVAILGKSLSVTQRNILLDKGLTKVSIMLDGRRLDDPTPKKAEEIRKQLSDFIETVEILSLPMGKDPNNILIEGGSLPNGNSTH